MKSRIKRIAVMLMAALLSACTLPGIQEEPSLSPIDQASTIVAGTLQAGGISNSSAITTIQPSETPSPATPTTKPNLYINTNGAKCRSGPGTNFQELASFSTGTTVDLIAKDTTSGYWLVKDPNSGNSCWVQVQDASPGGSFELVPEITPQAISQKAPGRPVKVNYNYFCDNSTLTTSLFWNAPSEGANGYRVYRFGTQVGDLPASQRSYEETVPFVYGSSMTYSVEAYNDAGASPPAIWEFTCP